MESAIICYALTLALFIPASGFLADRFGTRNLFIFSLILFSLGSLCSASSTTLLALDISRVIQGIGGAMMVPVSRLTLINAFERKDFLAALNTSTLLGLIGPFLGPLLGGYIAEKYTWHWIFLINIPIGFLGVVCAIRYMPNLRGVKNKLDIKGFLLISFAFIFTTLSLELLSENKNTVMAIVSFIIGGGLLYYYYSHAQSVAQHTHNEAIFPLSLFNVRTFRIGLFSNFISRLGVQAIPFMMPLLLQLVFDYSPIDSGLILAPIAIAAILMKELVTPILHRFGYRNVLIYSTFIVGFIVILLSFFDKKASLPLLVFLLFLMGFINSLRFTAMSSLTLADLHNQQTSSGNSLMAVSQQLAITFGVAIGAVLVRILNGHTLGLHLNLLDAFRMSFIFLGGITFLSGFIFLKLSKSDGRNLIEK
ncbi:transporter, major facilitator family protein [Providencia rettgeri DSM 1131]|uniref:MFS transporter n=1 Tax=Providencia rettgeri TaxID=587 RepID=UPI000197C713|nr:MFS transporter [Providencia rettgeri]EFE51748.1 transporter, major facilitator family protein [Providencia rettgeri DSM 1131]